MNTHPWRLVRHLAAPLFGVLVALCPVPAALAQPRYSTPTWVDRSGAVLEQVGAAGEYRSAVRHPPAALAAERDELLGVTVLAAHAQEAVLEATAFQVRVEFLLHVPGQRPAGRPHEWRRARGNVARRAGKAASTRAGDEHSPADR